MGINIMKLKAKKIFTVFIAIIMLFSCTSYSFAATTETIGYETNASGETYGKLSQANVLGYQPDLIFAAGENGIVGYVRAAELDADEVKTPEEAIELQNYRIATNYKGKYIPLYKSDGKTVIGKFLISFDLNDIADTGSSQNNTIIKASTDYAYGTEYGVSCSGYQFYIKSGIKKASGGVRGISCIRATTAVPEGYMGAKARIIRYNDQALVRETNWYYNENSTNKFSIDAYYLTVTGNQFFAQGYTREFNTSINDYWTHQTNNSPNVTSG